jgi:hypothetical protein
MTECTIPTRENVISRVDIRLVKYQNNTTNSTVIRITKIIKTPTHNIYHGELLVIPFWNLQISKIPAPK